MIKIISNATVGCHMNHRVILKTKKSEPFELDAKTEAVLVSDGVAEYVIGDEITNDELTGDEITNDELTLDNLKEMKLANLKEFAESVGVKYKVGMKKDDLIEAVWKAMGY